MSDRLSPENLGKNFYIAYHTNAHLDNMYDGTVEEAIENWHDEEGVVDKSEWIAAAQTFCKYLKAAEADS